MSVSVSYQTNDYYSDLLRQLDEDPPTETENLIQEIGDSKKNFYPKDNEPPSCVCNPNGNFSIQYLNVPKSMHSIWQATYAIVQLRTWLLVLTMCFCLVLFLFLFATVYFYISDKCGLGLENQPFSSSLLFSFQIHFRAAMDVHRDPHQESSDLFWGGCMQGSIALFAQIFLGNLLMSLLISSLMLSFHSNSRRTQNRFNCITLSRKAVIQAGEENPNFSNSSLFTYYEFCVRVTETNSLKSRKVTNCTANVYLVSNALNVFTNITSTPNVALTVTLPTTLSAEIPKEFVFPSKHPINEYFSGECDVCGKEFPNTCGGFRMYLAHLEGASDLEHDAMYELVRTELGKFDNAKNIPENFLNSVQFLVIVEARDPSTGNSILVKRIYSVGSGSALVGAKFPDDLGISKNAKNAAIYYNNFI